MREQEGNEKKKKGFDLNNQYKEDGEKKDKK